VSEPRETAPQKTNRRAPEGRGVKVQATTVIGTAFIMPSPTNRYLPPARVRTPAAGLASS
jgi:hypothetical protein